MTNIVFKKYLALKQIINSYVIYKGGIGKELEQKINSLSDKIDQNTLEELKSSYVNYQDQILNILANTRRVFIKLEDNKKIEETNFDDLEQIFKDLD